MNSFRLAVLAGALLGGSAGSTSAAGFYLQEQSVRGAARAYSGEVADLGAASLWWNPAAIARTPRQAYLGAHAVLVEGRVDHEGSTLTYPGGAAVPVSGEPRTFNPISSGLAPNFAASAPIGRRAAAGISLAAPYNFTTRYRPRSAARYDALESRLTTADLQLSVALRATDWLDVGAALSAQYADSKLSSALPNLPPALPDGVSQLRGNGWAIGWVVGAQARLHRTTVGLSYRSSVDHELRGRVFVGGLMGPLAVGNRDVAASASFSTPWIATAGVRRQLTDQLTVNLQVQRFGWSEFDAITVSAPGGEQILIQNYKDTTTFAAGLDYQAADWLTLRAGVQRDPTPTRDTHRNARVPDGSRWLYGLGASGRVGPRTEVDAAVAYIDFKRSPMHHEATLYGGAAAVASRLRGQVDGQGFIIGVGARNEF
jgi:long-chain fatty acid transport protein